MNQLNEHNKCITAPKKCSIEATDVDEHAHNLRNWQQQYDQMSNGKFYGLIDEVVLDDFHTFHELTSQALRQKCNVWPNAIWLGFSANKKTCRINGQVVAHNQIMLRPGSTEFELVTPEQFDIFGIVVSQDSLNKVAEKQGLEFEPANIFASPRSWQTNKLNNLKYFLSKLLTQGSNSSAAEFQKDLLITTVLDVIKQTDETQYVKPSFKHRKAVIDKVQAYLIEQPHKPVTITELCDVAHVSRRTLQYSFEDILGISPLRFLRTLRLNGVRRALLEKNSDHDDSVARVAQDWGFLHAGQFSHDYTQLFGENPSLTVKKQNRKGDT